MAEIVTLYPTASAAETGAGLTNPSNAFWDDGVYATGTPGKNTTLATKYQNFNVNDNIPVGSTITKVEIILQYNVSTTASVMTARTYAKVSGSAKANHDDATEPAADTTTTYDITADDSWTRAKLLNGVLEIVLAAVQGSSSTAVTTSFDYVQLRVTYVPGGSFKLNNFQSPSVPNGVSTTEKAGGINN